MNRFRRANRVPLLSLAALGILVVANSPARAERRLTVFAAASLTDAFGQIARDFEKTEKDVKVRIQFAGSQQLAAQLEQGAAADVFASADDRWMTYVDRAGLLGAPAVPFVRNTLVLIVPKTNPGRVDKIADLARRGVKFVLAGETVPVGSYARESLKRLSNSGNYGKDFSRKALANVVSNEENVRAVVGKVQLGEADAGIVYRSDVTPSVARHVRSYDMPPPGDIVASYPIARTKAAEDPALADRFVAYVLSRAGQATLVANGFLAQPRDSL